MTASTTPGDGAGSVNDAAAAIERLLSGEPEKQKRPKAETAPQAEAVEAEAEGDEAEETAPEAEQAESAEAEGSDDDAENETEDSEQQERVYTVKVGGKEMQVPESELLAGYSRTADYTRKTEALAHERRSFQAEIEKVQTERAQYAQLLPALAQQIQSAMPLPPDPKLRESDPISYMLAKDEYEEKLGRLQAASSEMQRLQQENAEMQTKQLQAAVAQGYSKMLELIPEWKDKAVYEKDRTELRGYLNGIGYSDEEIDQAYDPRAIALARKAMRLDRLEARRPRPDAPLEKALRPVPPVNSQAPRKAKEAQTARKRLAETGRMEDAAAAIRALL